MLFPQGRMTADAASTPPARDSFVGRTIRGTYRILQVLDHGGMGMVFIAEHVRLKRKVALKVLAAHLAADADALDRFHREAEIVSQLHHPNIVQITDFDTTEDGEPYIVMELLFGECLADRLERDRRLALSEVVRLVSQVASALEVAHRAGIVHRDLKPANIFLVNVQGQATYVKLLDFGISKRAGAGRKITREFDILGTPDYMAPEQARGQTKNVDHRADQYSLAAITYELLSGEVPFPGDDVMTVLQKVISERPRPITELVPELPPAIDAILQRALDKHPNARFSSILELAGQLETAARGAASLSVPPVLSGAGSDRPPESRLTPAGSPASRRESETAKTEYAAGNGVLAAAASAASATHQLRIDAERTEPEVPGRPPFDSVPEGDRMTPVSPSFRRRRSTAPKTDPVEGVNGAIHQARQALAFDDIELAVSYAEAAIDTAAEAQQPAIDKLIEDASTLFSLIFERTLGGLKRHLAVLGTPKTDSQDRLSPQQVFLLTRLDGATTVEEALDLSPLSRVLTLRLLVALMRQRLIEVR
jgi:serine/threonine protein kinase